MKHIHKSVIKLLLYYDIFDHALNMEEIIANCSIQENGETWREILDELKNNSLVYEVDGLFMMRNETFLLQKRIEGSNQAAAIMPKAMRMAQFISKFPFVRSVSLSGSLSKDYMNEKGDIDYFIIAHPERLWLARTLLIFYKRLFLLNSHKYFCLNYFVDTAHMEIEQKNLFTATELFTLMPVSGRYYVSQLLAANPWVKDYFPKFPQRDIDQVEKMQCGYLKRFLEWMLNNQLGDWLDRLSMKMTVGFWHRKYKDDPNDLFNRSFRLNRHIAKYHPENFQDLVLERFEKKVREYEREKKITLS